MLGIGQSNVAYWVRKGVIPSKWHAKLLSLGLQNSIDISAIDLISSNPKEYVHKSNTLDTNTYIQDFPATQIVENMNSKFMFYASDNGSLKIQVVLNDETVWASQKSMAEIFNVDVRTISEHLQNIFKGEELEESTTIRKFRIVVDSGNDYNVNFYNLDAIISVGYRVNSYQATQFRKWATSILKEHLIKGFTLDDERLKQANQLFSKDYFDELLERIREIRASERRFYQKITDIYSQCSVDYDKNSPITQNFYAHVQDKLHYAIHQHTSSSLIKKRADADKPNMGLNSWSGSKKGGKITRTDIKSGLNYLTYEELNELNRLVSMFLDFSENFVRRKTILTMQEWVQKLDDFLVFNSYEVLSGFGTTRREGAEQHAVREFDKFSVIQDKTYESDFDKIVEKIKTNKK
ncbi:MAG: virulence RhuM family protein [Bdellovibrio sp.]|nr:virulence RhuM family protein [Methylotenera sp.]